MRPHQLAARVLRGRLRARECLELATEGRIQRTEHLSLLRSFSRDEKNNQHTAQPRSGISDSGAASSRGLEGHGRLLRFSSPCRPHRVLTVQETSTSDRGLDWMPATARRGSGPNRRVADTTWLAARGELAGPAGASRTLPGLRPSRRVVETTWLAARGGRAGPAGASWILPGLLRVAGLQAQPARRGDYLAYGAWRARGPSRRAADTTWLAARGGLAGSAGASWILPGLRCVAGSRAQPARRGYYLACCAWRARGPSRRVADTTWLAARGGLAAPVVASWLALRLGLLLARHLLQTCPSLLLPTTTATAAAVAVAAGIGAVSGPSPSSGGLSAPAPSTRPKGFLLPARDRELFLPWGRRAGLSKAAAFQLLHAKHHNPSSPPLSLPLSHPFSLSTGLGGRSRPGQGGRPTTLLSRGASTGGRRPPGRAAAVAASPGVCQGAPRLGRGAGPQTRLSPPFPPPPHSPAGPCLEPSYARSWSAVYHLRP